MGDIYKDPPQSRNEAILRSTIGGTTYTAPPQSRIEDLLIELKEKIEEGYASESATRASIAPTEENAESSSRTYLAGEQFYLYDILYTATKNITQGASIITSGSGQSAKESETISEQINDIRENIIYGFHVSGDESDPDKMVTYLADAVDATPAFMDYEKDEFNCGTWEDAFFMPRPCMLKSDGTVDYYLDVNDFSKKEDGVTDSDISNTSYDGNAMMEWGRGGRRIWYKVVPDKGNNGASVFIANHKADEYYADYPFHDQNGNSSDHFYTAIYNGSVVEDKMRSLSGQQVSNSLNGDREKEKARANNPVGTYMWDIECFADRVLINFLIILITKSVNTQEKCGQGANGGGSQSVNNAFVTGQHNNKGLFYGTNSGTVSSTDFSNIVKIFGMENFYGFQWRRINGLILSSGTMKYKLTYSQEDGSTTSGYNNSGNNYKESGSTTLSGSSGNYISKEFFTQDAMFPTGELNGSSSTYYCDACWCNNSIDAFAVLGGSSSYGARVGAFCCDLTYAVSSARWFVGAALSCKPLAQRGELRAERARGDTSPT